MQIVITTKDLEETQTQLNATNAELARASRRAINKTLSWVRTHGRRAIARESGVPMKALRQRIFVTPATDHTQHGSVWFGIAPIKAIYIGTAYQTRSGVTVGRHSFPGAFLARMPSGHRGVFKRVGRARLPIKEATVSLEASRAAMEGIAAEAPARMNTIFAHEIDFAVGRSS